MPDCGDLEVDIRVAEEAMEVVDYVSLPLSWDEIEVVYEHTTSTATPFVRHLHDSVFVVSEMPFKCVDLPFSETSRP